MPETPTRRRPASTRPDRPFPVAGGHVTVRVVGFDEELLAPGGRRPDALGRIDVVLAREPGGTVSVTRRDGRTLGHLPASWARMCDRELWRCEVDGRAAVARATLSGPKGERDLCVLLAWPHASRP